MAEFRGTEEEFTRFVGPSIRNRIQKRTLGARRKAGRCQNPDCQNPITELHAAHIRGEERPALIRRALEKYRHPAGGYHIPNLALLEREIWEMHLPLEAHFRWLCTTCHNTYDREPDSTGAKSVDPSSRAVREEPHLRTPG
jgi:hypothetical protein